MAWSPHPSGRHGDPSSLPHLRGSHVFPLNERNAHHAAPWLKGATPSRGGTTRRRSPAGGAPGNEQTLRRDKEWK